MTLVKAITGFLLRLSRTKLGAGMIISSGYFAILRECGLFTVDPDIGICKLMNPFKRYAPGIEANIVTFSIYGRQKYQQLLRVAGFVRPRPGVMPSLQRTLQ